MFNGAEVLSHLVKSHARNIPVKIISKSVHRFSRRSYLKQFSIYSPCSHVVQRSETVSAILMDGHPRNIPVVQFQNPSTGLAEEVVLNLYFIYSSGGHLV